jgi:arsenate reductase
VALARYNKISHGLKPRSVIEYLKTPPTTEELDAILTMLDMQPRELMRKNEAEYKATSMDNPYLDRDALIAGMVSAPAKIEKPIISQVQSTDICKSL